MYGPRTRFPRDRQRAYRVVSGDKVGGGGRRRERVERVLALDGRCAETVHGHAVRLMGRGQPAVLVRPAGGRLAHAAPRRPHRPLAGAHGAQHLLAERVVTEHVDERVERGGGQRARVHQLVRQLDHGHVHEQRRPAE